MVSAITSKSSQAVVLPPSAFAQSVRVLKDFAHRGPLYQLALIIGGIAASALVISAMHYVYETFIKDEEAAAGNSNPFSGFGVSEPSSSQPPALTSAAFSTKEVAEVTMAQPNISGIVNTAGTNCFINSAIQVVIHTGMAEQLLDSEIDMSSEWRVSDRQHIKYGEAFDSGFRQFLCEYQSTSDGQAVDNSELMRYLRDRLGFAGGRQDDSCLALRRIMAAYKHPFACQFSYERVGTNASGESYRSETHESESIISLPIVEKDPTVQACWDAFASTTSEQTARWEPTDNEGRRYNFSGFTESFTTKKLPPKLVVSLKRFRTMGAKSFKDSRDVQYAPELTATDAEGEKTYQLQAFIHHDGGLEGGHYIAYVKKNDQWFCFDDRLASAVTEEDAQKAAKQAYVLIYDQSARLRSGSSSSTSETHSESPLEAEAHQSHEAVYQEFMAKWNTLRSETHDILSKAHGVEGEELLALGAKYLAAADAPQKAAISRFCECITVARSFPELRHISFVEQVRSDGILTVPNDGNCLFGAFATASADKGKIITDGNLTNHVAVRQQSIAWVRANKDRIPSIMLANSIDEVRLAPKYRLQEEREEVVKSIIAAFASSDQEAQALWNTRLEQLIDEIKAFEAPPMSFEDYLKRVSELKSFASEAEIYALSQCFKVPILIEKLETGRLELQYMDETVTLDHEWGLFGAEHALEDGSNTIALTFGARHYNAKNMPNDEIKLCYLFANDVVEYYRSMEQPA